MGTNRSARARSAAPVRGSGSRGFYFSVFYFTGSGRPGASSFASRHEILPENPVPGPTSPALFGELSRRLPSELVVHSVRPVRNGLVGSSSGPPFLRLPAPTGLRKNSPTRP